MKRKISLLFTLTLIVGYVNAQSSIVSLTVSPSNPTVYDTVFVYAELMFPNSGCELDHKNHTVIGNVIGASTMHCLGLMTTICYTKDTFRIDPLPSGTYTFDLTLSSGYGGPPCTPGIVPDDNDTISFVVSGTVGINETKDRLPVIFPNPVTDILTINEKDKKIHEIAITAYKGDIVLKQIEPGKRINVSGLSKGIYLLQIQYEDEVIILKFVKE